MLVKDLQQFLGSFTDKLKGNAISHAKIYVEKNGYLEEIKRMEVQEHTIIGQPGLRLVLKTHKDQKLKLDDKLIKGLRQRINELMAINKSHQQLMGKMTQENEELKKDNKALAKQIDDYFNMRGKGL